MCRRINGTIFKFVFVHLYFIVFLYLTVMIETVNNTNEDELMPHLYKIWNVRHEFIKYL